MFPSPYPKDFIICRILESIRTEIKSPFLLFHPVYQIKRFDSLKQSPHAPTHMGTLLCQWEGNEEELSAAQHRDRFVHASVKMQYCRINVETHQQWLCQAFFSYWVSFTGVSIKGSTSTGCAQMTEWHLLLLGLRRTKDCTLLHHSKAISTQNLGFSFWSIDIFLYQYFYKINAMEDSKQAKSTDS